MGDQRAAGIAWTDQTWNPIRGCSRVSEGCRHCYAETVAARFSWPAQRGAPNVETGEIEGGRGAGPYHGLATAKGWTGEVRLIEEHLADPLRWKRPRRVFVNSMSDLFHERVPDEWIDRIFAVMALSPRHTFQVLTKRPERMRAQLHRRGMYDGVLRAAEDLRRAFPRTTRAPVSDPTLHGLPNVWLGVSVEDQRTADERIPLLLETPAAVRFVSYEPALEPVDFLGLINRRCKTEHPFQASCRLVEHGQTGIDWLIVGGESGPGARWFEIEWARSTIAACRAAGVACFLKQLGARPCDGFVEGAQPSAAGPLERAMVPVPLRLAARKGGDPAEWPEDLRVREFPEAGRPA